MTVDITCWQENMCDMVFVKRFWNLNSGNFQFWLVNISLLIFLIEDSLNIQEYVLQCKISTSNWVRYLEHMFRIGRLITLKCPLYPNDTLFNHRVLVTPISTHPQSPHCVILPTFISCHLVYKFFISCKDLFAV